MEGDDEHSVEASTSTVAGRVACGSHAPENEVAVDDTRMDNRLVTCEVNVNVALDTRQLINIGSALTTTKTQNQTLGRNQKGSDTNLNVKLNIPLLQRETTIYIHLTTR